MKVKEITRTPNYIMVKMDPQGLMELREAGRWCSICQCGKQVNRWSFAFKTDAELTMFTLRWLK